MAMGPYQNLTAADGVDWQHVDSSLLERLDSTGARLGKMILITSGYRTPEQSSGGGGYATDPHTRGVAVDAQIDGRYIGLWPLAAAILEGLGLEPGTSPNFYQGKPDPMHVQIRGSGIDKTIHAIVTWASGKGKDSAARYSTPPSSSSAAPAAAGVGCLVVLAVQLAAAAILVVSAVELLH